MVMFNPSILHPSLKFKAVRSSGKGGQHVNKVSTAVELYFDVEASEQLTGEQKFQIKEKLKNRVSREGVLILSSQSERSQLANKREVVARFDELIQQALKKKRKRIPTKVSKAQKQARLASKKHRAEIKSLRKKEW